jgi:hypothetical protein
MTDRAAAAAAGRLSKEDHKFLLNLLDKLIDYLNLLSTLIY